MSRRKKYTRVALVVASMFAEGQMPAARAQQVEPPAPAPSAEPIQKLDEVMVTGSRIKRTTDFSTPTPTTVIDSSVLDNLGIVNLGQALQDIPSNLSQVSPGNTANSPFFTGSYLADLRGLNSFFGSRTLTLIDTRRAVQTNQGDSFDLNLIPNILVQRIDTVTGGASAAYGSGAISGVVNVILDKKLEGGKFNADIYQTEQSDGQDRHIAAAYGHGLMDDRIHFVLGGEYEHQDAVGCQDARSWCAKDTGWAQTGGILQSNLFSETPTYTLVSGLRSSVNSRTGAFYPNALITAPGSTYTSYQANGDGTAAVPYSIGAVQYASGLTPATNLTTVVGGDGVPINQYVNLMPEIARGVITGMVTAKITDYINFSADANWGKTSVHTSTGANNTQPLVSAFATPAVAPNITADNAYLDSSLQNVVGAGYNSLNKDWSGQVPLTFDAETNVRRFTVGFDGKVPGSSWTWDAYYEYGLTHREQLEPNEIRNASQQMALDSVLVDPVTGAKVAPGTFGAVAECRVTAAGSVQGVADPNNPFYNPYATYANQSYQTQVNNSALAAGCVPINPFGTGSVPANALGYSFGNLDERLRYEQTVAALGAQGEIWRGIGAGPFALAAGFEWRQEKGENNETQSCLPSDFNADGTPKTYVDSTTLLAATTDTCTLRSQDFAAQFGTPFGGLVTVDEAYAELNLPLARDLPFVHAAELDIAGRFSRYDNVQLYAEEPATELHPGDPNVTDHSKLELQSGPESTHNLTTWKVSGFYEPVEGVRLRGSQSRDSRAPDLRELYYAQQLAAYPGGFGICSHPGQASTALDSCYWNLLGNVNLAPETADTTTVGFVLAPPQVPGLQFSADWFHIHINDPISQANVAQVELACSDATAGGSDAACAQMEFNQDSYIGSFDCTNMPTGPFAPPDPGCGNANIQQVSGKDAWRAGALNALGINARSYNGQFYNEKGVDLSVNYTLSLPDNSTLFFRTLATYAESQTFQAYAGGPVYDTVGQVGGLGILGDITPSPRWRGNASITWMKGIVSLTPSMDWVGSGKISYLGVTPDQTELYAKVSSGDPTVTPYGYVLLPSNHVGSYFKFNLNATLNLENKLGLKGAQVYLQVNNLFNRDPPYASAPGQLFGSGTAGTNPILYDTLGMASRLGFRLNF